MKDRVNILKACVNYLLIKIFDIFLRDKKKKNWKKIVYSIFQNIHSKGYIYPNMQKNIENFSGHRKAPLPESLF